MTRIKEAIKRFYPLSMKKYDIAKQEERKFLQNQINYLKKDISSFNEQLKELINLIQEERKVYLKEIVSLKKENSLLSEKVEQLVKEQADFISNKTQSITNELKNLEKNQADYIKQENTSIKKQLKDSQKEVFNNINKNQKDSIEKVQKAIVDNINKTQKEIVQQIIKANRQEIGKQSTTILLRVQNQQKRLEKISGSVQEIVWANIFNSTLNPQDRSTSSYSPGRWAIGYPCLYAMYRILSIMKPKNILELGLGQSTVMISDYVAKHENVMHTVVERSPEWVEFFTEQNKLPKETHIAVLDYEFAEFGGKRGIRVFKDFEKTVGGKKYDFVCIDAPWGFDMKDYSRIDVLRSLSADFLAPSFVILIDDTNRKPETNMVNAMRAVLFGRGIATAIGKYRGDKECTVICTEDLAYLTSM